MRGFWGRLLVHLKKGTRVRRDSRANRTDRIIPEDL
jgi:hypothetical protein